MEWGCTISNIVVTGDGSLKVGGGADRIEEADSRCKYTGFWEDYEYGGGCPVAVVEQRPRQAHRALERVDVRKVALRYSHPRHTICIWGRS